VDDNFFKYKGKYYRQTIGLPMGGSLSVNISGIYVNKLLNDVLNKSKIKPKIMIKYIDDLLVIMKTEEIDGLLKELNSYYKDIKFTKEDEKDNKINYLDLTIIRENNRIIKKLKKT